MTKLGILEIGWLGEIHILTKYFKSELEYGKNYSKIIVVIHLNLAHYEDIPRIASSAILIHVIFFLKHNWPTNPDIGNTNKMPIVEKHATNGMISSARAD